MMKTSCLLQVDFVVIFIISFFIIVSANTDDDALRRRHRRRRNGINDFVATSYLSSSKSTTASSSSSFPPVFFPINNNINNQSRPSFVNQSRIEEFKISLVKTSYDHRISVILPPQQQHKHGIRSSQLLQKVSKQIQQNSVVCKEIATNGGPFNSDGTCVGPVISQRIVINNSTTTTTWPGFGRGYFSNTTAINNSSSSSSNFYVLGDYSDIIKNGGNNNKSKKRFILLTDFVTGLFGWLVYDNRIVVDHGNDINAKILQQQQQQAPRTVIGIDNHNHWFLLVADGCEKCPPPYHHGMTLKELAKVLLLDVNAKYAINLDGGGSTTMVENGRRKKQKLINHPTCLDVLPIKCERPVATIICIG